MARKILEVKYLDLAGRVKKTKVKPAEQVGFWKKQTKGLISIIDVKSVRG